MKTAFYFAALCMILFIMQSPQLLFAQTVVLEEIEAKIEKLEEEKTNLESFMESIDNWTASLEGDGWFMTPEGVLYNRKNFETHVAVKIYTGQMTTQEAAAYIKKGSAALNEFIRLLKDERNLGDKSLEKVRNELTYLLDERIRLKAVSDCIPNVNGTYIIAGDPTGYMILTQSGNHVEGFYGGDKNGLVNHLKGDFTCDELTGTFENTEYKITGTFKYKFSKDGSTYSGSWKNDTGGGTGTNSGRKEEIK